MEWAREEQRERERGGETLRAVREGVVCLKAKRKRGLVTLHRVIHCAAEITIHPY